MPRDAKPQPDRWWLPSWRVAVVLLLLGLLINLGVAVAIARWGTPPLTRNFPDRFVMLLIFGPPSMEHPLGDLDLRPGSWTKDLPTPAHWPGPVPESWESTPRELFSILASRRLPTADSDEIEIEASLNWAVGWRTEIVSVTHLSESRPMPIRCSHLYSAHRIGFPFATLRFDECEDTEIRFAPIESSLLYGGFRFFDARFAFRRIRTWTLPIMPVWPGIILNSVLYAFVLWLAWMPFQALRRRSRLRRGECVRCRYPIVPGKAVCPECGTPIALAARGKGLSNGDSAATDAADALHASAAVVATANSDHPTPNAPH